MRSALLVFLAVIALDLVVLGVVEGRRGFTFQSEPMELPSGRLVQNRSDRQLKPPSILRNSDISIGTML